MEEFKNHLHVTKEFLMKHYVDDELSTRAVGKIAGCSHSIILKRLLYYGIEIRNSKGSQAPHVTKEFLIEHYIKKDLSIKGAAKAANCSTDTIVRALYRFNIEKKEKEKTVDFEQYPHVNKEFLVEHYTNQRLSIRAIAKIAGSSSNLIGKRLKHYEIPTRTSMQDYTLEERKEKYGRRGEQHGLWKGGVAPIRNVIRNRLAPVSKERMQMDNYTCQECGDPNGDHHVHHKVSFAKIIDQIRSEHPELDIQKEEDRLKLIELCVADARLNDLDNLITLCEQCHLNLHTENPIEVVNYDILEKQWRDFVSENHFNMSVSEMTREIENISGARIRSYRVIKYMQAEKLKFSYENKEWLEKVLKEKSCSHIAKEFNSYQIRVYASNIRAKAFEFCLIDYESHSNDNKIS